VIKPQPNPPPPGGGRAYELQEPALVGPRLPGEVIVAETADRLIDLVAAEMVVQAKACVREFGDFELALCGGATPQPLYERLMYDPDCRQLPWVRTNLWLVDERAVDFNDPRSNFRTISETIVEHSGIPPEQAHPIMALSETADIDYEAKLREVLQWRQRGEDRLDFVLLGMGPDGHTASLFPFHEVLGDRKHLVRRVTVPAADPPQRVTMTYPLLNAARVVAVMVTGPAKGEALRRVADGRESPEALPITGVRPVNGALKWFLDAEACAAAAAPPE
jgi:6-phosphogluconolactonase